MGDGRVFIFFYSEGGICLRAGYIHQGIPAQQDLIVEGGADPPGPVFQEPAAGISQLFRFGGGSGTFRFGGGEFRLSGGMGGGGSGGREGAGEGIFPLPVAFWGDPVTGTEQGGVLSPGGGYFGLVPYIIFPFLSCAIGTHGRL